MKKLSYLLVPLLVIFVSACRNTDSATTGIDTTNVSKELPAVVKDSVWVAPDEEEKEEVRINYLDSINFKKYAIEKSKPINEKAQIDWTSDPYAKDFKTRIINSYNTNEVSFAGYYITTTFGCGTGCISGYMVDVRDGKIYNLPLGEENSCVYVEDWALFLPDSNLFISAVCRADNEKGKIEYKAFLWNEEHKTFEDINVKEFLIHK